MSALAPCVLSGGLHPGTTSPLSCGQKGTPPPPCASTALSKHGVGVELPFLGIFGTTVFVVPDVTWGLKTVYHTLPPHDVCFDVILSHSCYFPSTAYRHLHLRDLLDVGDHVCLP